MQIEEFFPLSPCSEYTHLYMKLENAVYFLPLANLLTSISAQNINLRSSCCISITITCSCDKRIYVSES